MLIATEPVLLSGLWGLFARAPELELRPAAAGIDEALAAAGEPADVVAVQDAALEDPRADCARLRGRVAQEVVVFEAAADLARLRAAVAGGARGFVTPEQGSEELRQAIAAVARQEAAVAPGLLRALLERLAETETEKAAGGREGKGEPDLMALLAAGHSFVEIGRYLGISPKTVRNRSSALYRSLGVRSRADAIRRAEQLGYLDDSDVA